MMYRMDDEVYESLCSALMENDCDDTLWFHKWLDKNYKVSELLESYENNGRKWYRNLADWVNEDLYTDFLTEMCDNAEFLAEFDIEKVEDDEDV